MLKGQTFEEKLEDLKQTLNVAQYRSAIVSLETIDQLLKAHQLKYIEKVLEVEEELKLAQENIEDFLAYDEDIQKAAIEAYPKSQADPDFFDKPENDKNLIKPTMILANIDNKKNEAKIKNWQVEYHARLINRLHTFKNHKISHVPSGIAAKLFRLFSK